MLWPGIEGSCCSQLRKRTVFPGLCGSSGLAHDTHRNIRLQPILRRSSCAGAEPDCPPEMTGAADSVGDYNQPEHKWMAEASCSDWPRGCECSAETASGEGSSRTQKGISPAMDCPRGVNTLSPPMDCPVCSGTGWTPRTPELHHCMGQHRSFWKRERNSPDSSGSWFCHETEKAGRKQSHAVQRDMPIPHGPMLSSKSGEAGRGWQLTAWGRAGHPPAVGSNCIRHCLVWIFLYHYCYFPFLFCPGYLIFLILSTHTVGSECRVLSCLQG